MAHDGSADILGHVQARTVLAQQHFLIELDSLKVHPDRTILLPIKHPVLQSLEDLILSELVGFRFIVVGIEADPHPRVAFSKAVQCPSIHQLPQRDGLCITLLPLHQHLLGLFLGRRIFLRPLGKLHIVFAHQMVALDVAGLGSLPVSELLIGKHGLADMHTAVVDQIHLAHRGSVSLQQRGDTLTETIITHVAQMQGLVGIRTAEFNGNPLAFRAGIGSVVLPILSNLLLQGCGDIGHIDADIQVGSGNQELATRTIRERLNTVF
ncbi:hypothetical protein SDC9_100307 [bioreactor metagenome]|uniref:Uncharacterized protein n=1 Tax=bioreactor metagenome TaxID=1076179 RepID=A0A645AK53_9ZZZZ